MTLYEQGIQYQNAGRFNYTLWEARPHSWDKNCYTLEIEWADGVSCGSVMTYFYADPAHGPTLAEVVEKYQRLNK